MSKPLTPLASVRLEHAECRICDDLVEAAGDYVTAQPDDRRNMREVVAILHELGLAGPIHLGRATASPGPGKVLVELPEGATYAILPKGTTDDREVDTLGLIRDLLEKNHDAPTRARIARWVHARWAEGG